MPLQYKLGFKPSEKDSRDYKYSSPLRNHKILPIEYELPITMAIFFYLSFPYI